MSGDWLETSVKGFLLDISGVIYDSLGTEGGIAVDGSVEAVGLLRKHDIPFRFCTNESTASRKHLCAKLQRIGFDIKPEEITTSAPIVVEMLHERNLRPFLLVMDEIQEEFAGVNTLKPNCVVIGDAQKNFTYENMNRAFSVLMKSTQPVLISMGCGRYYKEPDGLKMDVGAYCKGLEYACGIKAEFVGKPNASYFQSACDSLKLPPQNVVMIGDDVKNDIGGAQSAGLSGVLVRTGKYRPEDEQRKDVLPNGVVDNLLQAVNAFLQTLSK